MPSCTSSILNPINTWKSKEEYDKKALYLSSKFNENFKKYKNFASNEVINAMPKTEVEQEN